MTTPARDRLRELLDAVLDEDHRTLGDMAQGAFSSPFHFSRELMRGAGEPPVTMRRRVLLERAAWSLGRGGSVTDAAFAAGYESVEGFSRAFARAYGHPPGSVAARPGSHWLPSPNGIHFHPPTSLWVDSGEANSAHPVGAGPLELMVHHDIDDIRALLAAAATLPREDLDAVRVAGSVPLSWDGPDETIGQVLRHLVQTKEVWLAAVEGRDLPELSADASIEVLGERHDEVAARWLALVRDTDRRGAWADRIVDALCEPPESFVLGGIVAHVLTYSAHRRQLLRLMLRAPGRTLDEGDPITWLRRRSGGTA